eukprot:GSMAST32.ASY1.ANO1.957.1 assembled CDS
MKIRTISRSVREHTRERPQDLQRVHRNLDPALHPFSKQREFVRAVNASKLNKIFAKPFIAHLVAFISGDGQGVVKVWDLAHKKELWSVNAHRGVVQGLKVSSDGRFFFSCGKDKTVQQYRLGVRDADSAGHASGNGKWQAKAVNSWTGTTPFNGIDHHWRTNTFATCSDKIEVWDHSRSSALSSFTWGADKIRSCKFNPAEATLLGSVANDRNIVLYDVRGNTPMKKIIMEMSSNALAWNPMEPMNFTVANEDNNLYTFDMRKMESALMVHKDHLSAVMDIAYSPTVYHTRRMQRIFYDTNVRIWKAQASKALGRLLPREKNKQKYHSAIVKKYSEVGDIKRISGHRHLPKVLLKMRMRKDEQLKKNTRKLKNRRKHSKPGSVVTLPERKKQIVRTFD